MSPNDLNNSSSTPINGNLKLSQVSKSATGNGGREEPVTKIFSDFVANLKYDSIAPEIRENLKSYLLDYICISAFAAAKVESSDSFYRAILAFSGNAPGNATVLTKGHKLLPQYAALLNGAYCHTLDFDDTFAEGPTHIGCAIISAGLAQAEVSGVAGKTLLTGLAAGYEIACRLARALGTGAYERGFHNTGTAGIFGAIATIMKIKGANAATIEAAFGLAGSKAAGSTQFLDNGAWNKRLHPGFAAHDAMMCVALAEEGVIGATKSIEGASGFLHAYSVSARSEGITDGLGKEWVHVATALKPYPACRYTHAAIDMAAKWRPIPSKIHPRNTVDAQFSFYYQLAIAWLDGNETGWAVYDRINDKDVHELSERITIEPEDALEAFACRLEIRWNDGTTDIDLVTAPLGELSNPFTWEHLRKKFRSLSVPIYGEETSESIIALVQKLDDCQNLKPLMSLLV